jgi:hypothetical protein
MKEIVIVSLAKAKTGAPADGGWRGRWGSLVQVTALRWTALMVAEHHENCTTPR